MSKSLRNLARPAQPVRGLSPAASEFDDGHALFEALVCEFHWTALQTAAVAACMNASASRSKAWMLRSCSNLMPVESPVVRKALGSAADIRLTQDLTRTIRKIYHDLSDTKRVTMPIIRDAGAFTGPSVTPGKLHQIAAHWRKLSEDCEAAVQELEPETRWRLGGLYTGNSLVLGKFLKLATSGAYNCVNQVGEVAIPVLPQRRRSTRQIFVQPCVVRGANAVAGASSRDLSRNDIRLKSEQAFELKERVTVEFRNGRKLRGTVVWMRDDQFNVLFEEPLPDHDVLLTQ